ncbi:ArsC family reductase [Glaciecola sp. KUL10]|jgi:Spx/MgsR family transcriptional regulator|uniref:ArsC family reductase n=1 Tax=Glaciecola sp. (strain KUL10) TaxID=2161813 RepID=UPI000D787C19|nr:ArsC family reductase [Glaciecola sp. KUL10]GBL03116.1 arsenate reductase [Glaciecola sp. KUL10]
MSNVTLFGIPNCDTIKKAKKWLNDNEVDFEFHDYRKDGLENSWLQKAEEALSWENILNKRGTTFRQLSDEQKNTLNKENAIALMIEMPAMIKRPILQINENNNQQFYLGFKPAQYEDIFKS